MDRAEATGLGVAVAGHAALLAVLSLGFASIKQPPLMNEPMEVSIVDEVALRSAVPEPATEAPAPSVAPELGAPEEPAPAPEPEPTPPAPQPEPVPPPPSPKPIPKAVIPPPPKPMPKPVPKPVPPVAKPAPKPAPPKPAPVKAAPPKPAPAKPAPAKAAPAKPAPAKVAAKPGPAKAAPSKSAAAPAASGKGQAQAARGSRLGRDFLKGIGADATPAKAQQPTGAVMSAIQLSGIKSAIQRQIQPCADRQVNPGPGANEIQVTLNLRLNPNGSLAGNPTVVRTSGVNEENSRYEKRVTDLAIAAYRGCAPLRGLPDELYRTAKGGWSNINMNYKLPG